MTPGAKLRMQVSRYCSSFVLQTLNIINILRVQAGQATISKPQLPETSVTECIHFLLPATHLSLADSESVGEKRKIAWRSDVGGRFDQGF